MTLLEQILGGAANAATGGILGLAGNVVQGIATYVNSKVQYAHEEKMADKELAAQEAGDADKLAQTDAAGGWDAFKASVGSTIGSFASGVLTICREGVTIYLLIMSTIIYNHSSGEVQQAIGKDIVCLCGMAVSWHFGQKPTLNYAQACAKNSVAKATSSTQPVQAS